MGQLNGKKVGLCSLASLCLIKLEDIGSSEIERVSSTSDHSTKKQCFKATSSDLSGRLKRCVANHKRLPRNDHGASRILK